MRCWIRLGMGGSRYVAGGGRIGAYETGKGRGWRDMVLRFFFI